MTEARLRELTTVFRAAIERTDRARLGMTFTDFPRGSCGDAALLLAHFLKRQGFADVIYVAGERGEPSSDWTSHAWLRVDGFTVDITSDQFAEVDEPVIVARESRWHDTFSVKTEHEGDFTVYDAATGATLAGMYAAIVAKIAERPGGASSDP